jgi:hypothetical protein
VIISSSLGGYGDSTFSQNVFRVCAALPRGLGMRRLRPRETRRRNGVLDPLHLEKRSSIDVVPMLENLGCRQDRRKAGIAALENLAPLVACLLTEKLLERGA